MGPIDPGGSYGPGLIRSMWRYKYAIVLATIVAVMLGYFVSTLLSPRYETVATLVLSDADAFGDAAAAPDPERRVQQEANRLMSRAVLSAAATELGGDVRAEDMPDVVSVSADPTVGLLEITAVAGDPERAAEIANTVVSSYQQVSREAAVAQAEEAQKVLQDQADALRAQISELQSGGQDGIGGARLEALRAQLVALETKISELGADAALFGAGMTQVEQALPPPEPTSPKPLRNAAITGVIVGAIAAALAYWRAGVVDSAKLDPTRVLGAPLLAEIPEFKRSSGTGGDSLFDLEATEAYQFLLASFEYAIAQSNARSILITSASPGEGKSLTSLHLARALALQGRHVMLVDADIRARGLTSLLRAEDQDGLVDLAQGGAPQDVVRQYRISEKVKLPVIPAGRPPHQPTGLLGTDRYRDAITMITSNNDLTIIDGGPLLTVADASALAAQVSGILLVINAKMPQGDLLKVHERLRVLPTPVLGYVLNRVSGAGGHIYPYYGRSDPSPGFLRRIFGGAPSGAHAPRRRPATVETAAARESRRRGLVRSEG